MSLVLEALLSPLDPLVQAKFDRGHPGVECGLAAMYLATRKLYFTTPTTTADKLKCELCCVPFVNQ